MSFLLLVTSLPFMPFFLISGNKRLLPCISLDGRLAGPTPTQGNLEPKKIPVHREMRPTNPIQIPNNAKRSNPGKEPMKKPLPQLLDTLIQWVGLELSLDWRERHPVDRAGSMLEYGGNVLRRAISFMLSQVVLR